MYKEAGNIKIKLFAAVCFLILTALFVFTYYRNIVMPVIYNSCEGYIGALASDCVNIATKNVTAQDYYYGDYVEVIKADDGSIVMLKSNMVNINLLSRNTVDAVQQEINKTKTLDIAVPSGDFSGINLLLGKGRDIYVTVIPIGSADCYFYSTFTEAGINQTVHRLYLRAVAAYTVALPFRDLELSYATDMLIAENVIVGKIPEIYLDAAGANGGLDLVA